MIKIPANLSACMFRPLLPLTLIFLSSTIQAQQQTIPPPAGSGAFGTAVVVLSNGNYIVTDPLYDDGAVTDVGAVHLYNGSSHSLMSTLKGNIAGSKVGSGGITVLSNSNFLVSSPGWGNGTISNAGAVTFVNGTSGLNAVVSNINSLTGASTNDSVGGTTGTIVLTNDNYVVVSSRWDDGATANVGAVTWCDGTTGRVGVVSSSNSLVGSKADDGIGSSSVEPLTNGNYVVRSSAWDNGALVNAGAATWCSGTAGTVGTVSSSNSLVGGKANDGVGYYFISLTNGNYVVCSPYWDNGSITDVGAATWGSGTTGIIGTISSSNSLIGSQANDRVSLSVGTALTNGNYVIKSYTWKNGTAASAGAITWGNGTTGTSGVVSSSNSLVGTLANDMVGSYGTALPNGNFVACSHLWNAGTIPGTIGVGAVTLIDGNGGTTGPVSSSNSLIGSGPTHLGELGATVLPSSNFIVKSLYSTYPYFSPAAVTWINGTTGLTGTVSSSNSLICDTTSNSITVLSNGNFVVSSPGWKNGITVGAATWVNGTTGMTGSVSSANSLIGTNVNSYVTALTNGNYVVVSPRWSAAVGAVTFCNGTAATIGTVSSSNSLVGGNAGDSVGSNGVLVLSNGNYVVSSPNWKNGTITGAGAATWSSGTAGVTGPVSGCNSLVGATLNEKMGSSTSIALSNGNYITGTGNWDNDNTFNVGIKVVSNGGNAITGTANSCSSISGTTANTGPSTSMLYNSVYDYTMVKNVATNSLAVLYSGVSVPALANANQSSASAISSCAATPVPLITKTGCSVIGSMSSSGANPVSGIVNTKVWIESVPPGGYVARHMEIAPVTNPTTATGKLTLYFTQQEFNDFNANPGNALHLPTGPADAAGIANLRVGRYNGSSNNGTGLPATYSGSVTNIDPADADIDWNATKSWWEVSFNMTGSGGFIIQTFNIPLSLDLLEFNGKLSNGDALLNWKTENEHNTTGFDVERSTDAKQFNHIGFVSSNNKAGVNFYSFTDPNIAKLGITEVFYRLKQNDIDGYQKYSQVVRLSLDNKSTATLYPNPATMAANLSITLKEADQLQLRILDNTGRVLQQKTVSVSAGNTLLPLDLSTLASGFYYIELQGKALNERKQFVKQ